ncbi:uncharacterized protein LOC112189935 [Rosa chinensis]|uniref:uncharacterized protein LOC112189935 n=1 Tax=Rosa chinensis TaxID=74649 RepID=UPI000D090F92|nr:uncharacterized protein LOC112189935 [Rosa chinensis]
MTQDGKPVAMYFAKLKGIWQEIDQMRPCRMKCPDDVKIYKEEQDLMRVHVFLAGLDPIFENARSELLRRTTTPTLQQAFAYIRKDETQRAGTRVVTSEVAGLAIQSKPSNPSSNRSLSSNRPPASLRPSPQGPPPGFSSNLTCNYCKNPGHIKANCYRLVGFPAGYFDRPRPQDNKPKGKAAVHLVQDQDYYVVTEPDYTNFAGKDTASDLLTREIIGRGYLRGRLFHLDCMFAGMKPEKAVQAALISTGVTNRVEELWLWHRRLGHPSFSVMKKSMPSLFLGIDESKLHCESCVLAKSHRTSYPLSTTRSSFPFELIHSDVWGPSRESTLSGKH